MYKNTMVVEIVYEAKDFWTSPNPPKLGSVSTSLRPGETDITLIEKSDRDFRKQVPLTDEDGNTWNPVEYIFFKREREAEEVGEYFVDYFVHALCERS